MRIRFITTLSLFLAYFVLLAHAFIPHHHHGTELEGTLHHLSEKRESVHKHGHSHGHSHSHPTGHEHHHPSSEKAPQPSSGDHGHTVHTPDLGIAILRTALSLPVFPAGSFSSDLVLTAPIVLHDGPLNQCSFWLTDHWQPPGRDDTSTENRRGPPSQIS